MGKKEKEKTALLLYAIPALCSYIMDITFGCRTLTEKDFLSKLLKSTYINMQNSGCIWSLQTQTVSWCLCCRRPLSRPDPVWRALCTPFATISDIGHFGIHFSSPYTGPWLFSSVSATRCRFWDYPTSASVHADKLLAELFLTHIPEMFCVVFGNVRYWPLEKRKHLF